jgi:lysosomal alpha-mannosidase
MNLSLILTLIATLALMKIGESKKNCPSPYSTCNLGKEGFINVHIVPHTHDDVGWLKTVDEYYFNTKYDDTMSVKNILDSVIKELDKDPNRRFVYVEIAFFWRWWNEQSNCVKETTRKLVDEGRLEFVIGGW